METPTIAQHDDNLSRKVKRPEGFSLIELLVVISIISMLMAILVPALGIARRRARMLLKISNQGQIVGAGTSYANEHDEKYPESTAKIGVKDYWGWEEPTMLVGYDKLSPGPHRSMATYLTGYLDNASVVFCPDAPRKYKHLQEAWRAGDDWVNPDTDPDPDPMFGTYCIYWNYVGYLDESGELFRGPHGPAGGTDQGSVLVTDYFGYDHWRSRHCLGSCEPLQGGRITEGTLESSAYWSRHDSLDVVDAASLGIELHAGYLDGHVSKYSPSEVVPMRVIINAQSNTPYPEGVGPGVFYLPREGLQ